MSQVSEQKDVTNTGSLSLLFFSLGPVQPFIEKARTVRDLMTGSYILAWLTSKAIAVIQEHDPGWLVTPFMASQFQPLDPKSPTLPNRFIAQVPADQAEDLANKCRRKCLQAWNNLADEVHQQLEPQVETILNRRLNDAGNNALKTSVRKEINRAVTDWDHLWVKQIGSSDLNLVSASPFDVHTHVLEIEESNTSRIEDLLGAEQSRDAWDLHYDMVWSLDAVRKSTRYVHAYSAFPKSSKEQKQEQKPIFVPGKCTLFGTYEQLGPAESEASRLFWEWLADDQKNGGVKIGIGRLRKRERLCAIGMVKRFAWSAYLQKEANHKKVPFEDTATVAGAVWLKAVQKQEIDINPAKEMDRSTRWSGHWLHWPNSHFDKDEPSCPTDLFKKIQQAKRLPQLPSLPTYYAILMLDGDKIGDKSREKSGIEAQRQLSQLISSFAGKVPKILEDHLGTLVYVGGDDVLALLPVSEALKCAVTLNKEFCDLWPDSEFNPTTVSAGIAIVHYKQDLRFALNAAREAEQLAKNSGRDALALTVCRRSGAHTTAVMPWGFATKKMQTWVSAFHNKASGTGSDRWAYALAAELPILEGLEESDAIKSEIKRLVNRSQASSGSVFVPKDVAQAFQDYLDFREKKGRQPKDAGFLSKTPDEREQILLKNAIRDFITLCQSASFIARGRDQ